MKKILIMLSITLSLFATEIQLSGSYSSNLGNPFKSIYSKKIKSVSIDSIQSKLVKLSVSSDYESSVTEFHNVKDEYSIQSNSCLIVLKDYLTQDYLISNNANKIVSCVIESGSIDLEYQEESLSNIQIKLNINLVVLDRNGDILLDKKISNSINSDYNKKGDNFDSMITFDFDFERLKPEEKINEMIEVSLFQMLNKNLRKGL